MVRFVSILSVMLLSASISFAKPGGMEMRGKMHKGMGMRCDGPGMLGPKEFKELNLSKEQREKVKVIREGSKEKGKALREENKVAKLKLKGLLDSEVSKEEITKAFDESQSKRQESAKFMFSQMLQIRDVLTPEQRAKVKTLRDDNRGCNGPDDGGGEEEQ